MSRPSPRLTLALARSLKDGQFLERDSGAVALARRYAYLIEQAEDTPDELKVLDTLGPKLLAVLGALALTPQSRAAVVKGGTPNVGTAASDSLAKLRAERAAR